MMEWHLNDKIMSEWAWNELFGTKGYYYPRPPFVPTVCQKCQWKMEWYSNNGMTFKWWNDIQMMEWYLNDGMKADRKWTIYWKNVGTEGVLLPRPPLCRADFYSAFLRLHPYFHTHIWMTIYLSEWALNDGMTFKWWNDIQMMKWHSNDGIILKWWNDTWMMK